MKKPKRTFSPEQLRKLAHDIEVQRHRFSIIAWILDVIFKKPVRRLKQQVTHRFIALLKEKAETLEKTQKGCPQEVLSDLFDRFIRAQKYIELKRQPIILKEEKPCNILNAIFSYLAEPDGSLPEDRKFLPGFTLTITPDTPLIVCQGFEKEALRDKTLSDSFEIGKNKKVRFSSSELEKVHTYHLYPF